MKYFILFLVLSFSAFSQDNLILNGPMLGYVEYREAMLWVQTSIGADVVIEYNIKGKTESYFTNMVRTDRYSGYTAKLLADNVFPGFTYEYKIYVNNQIQKFDFPLEFDIPALWEWRTDPPEFKMLLGSCAFINETVFDRPSQPYGGAYEIFDKMAEQNAELMLWLGDNVYAREVDWYSRTGFNHRYTHTRKAVNKKVLANSINIASWDDHDYGYNNSDRSFREKETALETFNNFWCNPGPKRFDGIYTNYVYADIEIIVLDNRFNRRPNEMKTEKGTWLGENQLKWFKDVLVASSAPYKLVMLGGQILTTTTEGGETYSILAPEEKQEIIDFIDKEKIKGVVFLTGDRHFTELSTMKTPNGVQIWDYTCSALTSGAYEKGCNEKNTNRVEGTCVNVRNFGTIEVKGPRKQRQLILKCLDATGKELWQEIILR